MRKVHGQTTHQVSVLKREFSFPSGLFHSSDSGYLNTVNLFGILLIISTIQHIEITRSEDTSIPHDL